MSGQAPGLKRQRAAPAAVGRATPARFLNARLRPTDSAHVELGRMIRRLDGSCASSSDRVRSTPCQLRSPQERVRTRPHPVCTSTHTERPARLIVRRRRMPFYELDFGGGQCAQAAPCRCPIASSSGGVIDRCSGAYYASAPVTSRDEAHVGFEATVPRGCRLAGLHHTHPSNSDSAVTFSLNDVRMARALGTDRSVRLFEPSMIASAEYDRCRLMPLLGAPSSRRCRTDHAQLASRLALISSATFSPLTIQTSARPSALRASRTHPLFHRATAVRLYCSPSISAECCSSTRSLTARYIKPAHARARVDGTGRRERRRRCQCRRWTHSSPARASIDHAMVRAAKIDHDLVFFQEDGAAIVNRCSG